MREHCALRLAYLPRLREARGGAGSAQGKHNKFSRVRLAGKVLCLACGDRGGDATRSVV